MALTPEQQNQILTQRQDVASNKYYSKNPEEWYNKYGKREGFSFSSTPQTQTSAYGTTFMQPSSNQYTAAPIAPTQQQYQFDESKYLPQIQQTASSIYQPQLAQLQALSSLSAQQYEQTKVQTEEDFQKRMRDEVEAINRRGAFFGGGAIANEQGIRTEQARTMNSLALQQQAAQADYLAQQGKLTAEQANYIKDQLYNTEAGAYARWKDTQNWTREDYQTQLGQYNTERAYNMDVAKFNQALQQQYIENAQWQKSFEFQVLSKKLDNEMDTKKLEMQYGLDTANLRLAQQKFAEEQSQFGQTMDYNIWYKTLESNKGASQSQWENIIERNSTASKVLYQLRESDGYVSPSNYNNALKAYLESGGTANEFTNTYSIFRNPALSGYNVTSSRTLSGN